uniref:DH domain-containing protein n=1 Tax=Timema tahoe TaxID=61484 RepID=A0A7R9NYT4_9NEOP|nr:unnamed protein product [Timema tahoe]
MAAISGKPKPVLPPKPPRKLENVICDNCSNKERCPLHGFCHERSLTYLKKDPSDEAHCEETSSLRVIPLRATEEETKLISNIERSPHSHESSVEVITEINKNVYKGENTKLITKKSSHKPPLLPKPPTLFPYASRTKSILSPTKITSITKPITKCTETSPSTCSKLIVGNHSVNAKQHTDTASKNLTLAYRRNVLCPPLSLQAPVAKLEEFDILYDSHNLLSPTRPPRIAKKLLNQGILATHSDNTPPELPAKKSLLSHNPYQSSPKECSPTIRGGTTWSYWQIHKGKSASLGRAEGQTLRFGNSDRNKFECTEQDFIGESIFSSSSIKPVPPPRRRKKLSSDDSPTMDPSSPVSPLFINSDQSSNYAPIYATVNYEMKKSRRSASFGSDVSSSTIGDNIGNLEIKQIKPHWDVTGMKTDIAKSQESNSIPIEEDICNHSSDDSLSINSSHYCEEKSSTCLLTETCIDKSKFDKISDSSNQYDNSVISNCVKIRSPLCEAHVDISCETTDTPIDLVPSFFISKDNTCDDSARKDLKNKNHNLESVTDLNSHSCSLTSYKVLPAQQSTLNTDSAFKEKVKLFCEHNNEMLCDSCLCYSSVNYNSSLTEIKYLSSLNSNATESLITQQPDSNCVNTTKDIPISICESESGSIESQHISNIEKKVKVSKSCHISNKNSDHCKPSIEDYSCELSFNSNSLLPLLKDVSQNDESLECSSSTNIDVICATNTSLVISDPIVIVNASNVLATRKNVTRTFSLPLGTKVNMKESKKGIFRRQSWSNLKSSHSSSSDGGINSLIIKNRKTRTHSFWCDEGELSSGALADVDSSDNAIKPYFFEEIIDGSEVSQNPKQGRIASWFNTLSKGNKNKDKRDSLSRFYYDQKVVSHENIDNGGERSSDIVATNLKLNSPEEDVNLPVYNIHDVNRPASGLSDTLDFDQKSDVPLSEDSFDIGPHSDSDNDDYGYTDAKDVLIEQKRDKKAFYIAHELMSSERIFIDVLKLLNIDFKNFVKQVAVEQKILVIPDEDLDKILNSLPQLQSLNEDFLHDLEDRISNWSSNKKMADVIVRIGPFLKLYTSYIQNFETQCAYLDECCIKYPKFAKVLKDFEATPRCQKLSLKHYMLKPIQRIPQYRLLLDDYLRNLLCESPDYEDTKTALKIVCDVADHANRSLKLGELEQDELDNTEDNFGGDNTDDDPDFVETQGPSDTEASECGDEELASNLPYNNQPGSSKINTVLTGKSGYKWHTLDPPRRGRTRTEDIVIHLSGSKGVGQKAKGKITQRSLGVAN